MLALENRLCQLLLDRGKFQASNSYVATFFDDLCSLETETQMEMALYSIRKELARTCEQYVADGDPVADEPSIRLLRSSMELLENELGAF